MVCVVGSEKLGNKAPKHQGKRGSRADQKAGRINKIDVPALSAKPPSPVQIRAARLYVPLDSAEQWKRDLAAADNWRVSSRIRGSYRYRGAREYLVQRVQRANRVLASRRDPCLLRDRSRPSRHGSLRHTQIAQSFDSIVRSRAAGADDLSIVVCVWREDQKSRVDAVTGVPGTMVFSGTMFFDRSQAAT